jgi:parallel beta-helix repeat protein
LGTTTLAGNTTVSTGNSDIDFKQTLNGPKTIDLAAGTGTIFFRGAVGHSTPLAGMLVRSAARATAFSTIALDGTSKLSADGLSIGANVNNVSMTAAGSVIKNFSGHGIVFAGTSTGSTLSGFTISDNGGDGLTAGTGSFSGSTISFNTISKNTRNGVSLTGSTGLNISDNTISNNTLDGVVVSGTNADDNTILSNSIFLNGGKGISLRNDGNDAQVSPRLISASLIGSAQVIRVRGIMQAAAGIYRVQLFANRPADEIGFPANRAGFEGRQVLPLADGTSLFLDVTVPVSGLQEFFADVPLNAANNLGVKVGDWITATATLVNANVPENTSEFSSAVQLGLPVLAAGSDGSNAVGAATVPGARLYGMSSSKADVVLNVGPALADARKNITLDGVYGTKLPASFGGGMRVTQVDVDGDGYKDLVTAPGELPTYSFTIVRASKTMTIPGNVLSLVPRGTTLVVTPQFPALGAPVSRTVTAATIIKGNTVISLSAPLNTATIAGRVAINVYGHSMQKIGIFNGSPEAALAWRFVTLDVAGVFGASYTGGFVVAAGELQGNTVTIPQIIVAPSSNRASFNGAAVFTVASTSRGATPVVVTTPTLRTPAVTGAITGLAVGAFSQPIDCSTAGAASVAMATATGAQTSVAVFGKQGTSLVRQNSFALKLDLNRGDGVMMNVFGDGASLAAGDIDGNLRSELLIAAGKTGMSNFRVIPGSMVLGGNQQAIDAALTAGAGQDFSAGTTGGRFFGSTVVANKINQVQQDNLDYWYGFGAAQGKTLSNVAGGFNAPLYVAIGDAEGRGRSQVFAALGAFNTTANAVVAFSFDTTQTDVTKRWSRKECFKALSPSGLSFASGMGLRLG